MQSPVFVGRREEIASLTALLERAAAAEPGFAIVAGEAGVGKTRLVTELAGRADPRRAVRPDPDVRRCAGRAGPG